MIRRLFNGTSDFALCDSEGVPLLDEITSNPLDYSRNVHLPCDDEEKWRRIRNALTRIQEAPLLTFNFVADRMNSYAPSKMELVTFRAMDQIWKEKAKILIPKIAGLAISLPDAIKKSVPLLLSSSQCSLTLSRHQSAVLLANAFFCTFSERPSTKFNAINFTELLEIGAIEPMKCILNYFEAIMNYEHLYIHKGLMTIARHSTELPNLDELVKVAISHFDAQIGRIEDNGRGMTMIDFADKHIGGTVLSGGIAQEEILFLLYPELIVSSLVCEEIAEDEAILIAGVGRFSNYEGYGYGFKWVEIDDILRSAESYSEIVAIDAIDYSDLRLTSESQYNQTDVNRELRKAFAGFSIGTIKSNREIATGNWGCGVFKGDLRIKSLIQLIAASLVERPLHYFTFGDKALAESLNEVVQSLRQNDVDIATLYHWILEYGEFRESASNCTNIFDFVTLKINNVSHKIL